MITANQILAKLRSGRISRSDLNSFLPLAAVLCNHLEEKTLFSGFDKNKDRWFEVSKLDRSSNFFETQLPRMMASMGGQLDEVHQNRGKSALTRMQNDPAYRKASLSSCRKSFETVLTQIARITPQLASVHTDQKAPSIWLRNIQAPDQKSLEELQAESNNLLAIGGGVATVGGMASGLGAAGSTMAMAGVALGFAAGGIFIVGVIGLAIHWLLTQL